MNPFFPRFLAVSWAVLSAVSSMAASQVDGRQPTAPICGDSLVLGAGDGADALDHPMILHGILMSAAVKDTSVLSPVLREQIFRFTGAKKDSELFESAAFNRILASLQEHLKPEEYVRIVGSHAAGIALATQRPRELAPRWKTEDLLDMNRGWGWQLLRDDDPAFQDPEYLVRLLRSRGASGDVMSLRANFDFFSNARTFFLQAWREVAPKNVEIERFALTGSEANNLAFDIARRAAQRRNAPNAQQAEFLYFDSIYGGMTGRIRGRGFLSNRQGGFRFDIPSPHSEFREVDFRDGLPTDEAERLEKLESQALLAIEKKFRESPVPIGGFFFEPIVGPKGVFFYRREFLLKLRELCDRLQIPIIGDEILTGGGRTGKFFAYQHYEGFEPDFVTFGKGLQVAGIARVSRKGFGIYYDSEVGLGSTTLMSHYDEPLLKGAQILKRIKDGKLLEHSMEVGSYFLERIRAEYGANRSREVTLSRSRGIGMLIYGGFIAKEGRVPTAMGRLMPPLSLTREEVDRLFDGPPAASVDKDAPL